MAEFGGVGFSSLSSLLLGKRDIGNGDVKPTLATKPVFSCSTVDGRNPANQLRLVVVSIIYRVLYIPGGAGFLPSTVCCSIIN